MAKHAILSPSSAKRWINCPGSVVISPPESRSSRAAAEGTLAHEIAAHVLSNALPDAQDWLGQEHTVDGFTFEVDQDMLDGVMAYVNDARDAIGDSPFLVEVAVPIGHLTGEEGATGTSDLVILRPDELEVRDLKFGRGVEVQAEENPQLVMYALGTLEVLESVIDLAAIKRVRCTIHQPRLAGPKEVTYTMAEMAAWREAISRGATAVRVAEEQFSGITPAWGAAHLAPSNEGCRFCPAKATCPALAAETLTAVAGEFDDLTTVTPDLLAANLGRVERVEAWCKAVRAEVERRLLQNIPVPGYKLVAGRRGMKRWIDPQDAAAALEKLIGADAWERSLISPTKAAKIVGKGAAADEIGNLTTSTEGRPSVAPESDPRPAITAGATTEEFDNLETEN